MTNEKSLKTVFETCHIENNTSKNDIINVQNSNILIRNLTFVKNVGRIISCLDMIMTIKYYSLLNHSCISVDFEGCFFYLENSNVTMSNIKLEYINSTFTTGLITMQFSTILIQYISIYSIDSMSANLLLNGRNSSVTLQNSFFEFLNKSLIFLESGSTLFVLSCNFSSINVDQVEFSIISCKNCEYVLLKLNSFFECTSKITAGAVTLESGNF